MKNYAIRFGSGDPRSSTGLAPTMVYFIRQSDGQTIAPPGFSEVLTGSGLYSFQWGTTQAMVFLADGATSSLGTGGRYVTGALDPADRADEYGTSIIALGTTSIALGTTSVALGTTSVALGMTTVALGTTTVALGTTSVSWGSANSTALTNQGSTLVAIGNTSSIQSVGSTLTAIGSTLLQGQLNIGSTLVAVGNTMVTAETNMGTTLVAIGNSLTGLGLTAIPLIGTLGSTFGSSSTDPVDMLGYLKRIQENLEGNQTFTKGTGAWQISSRGSSTVLANKTVSNGASLVTRS
jgi:hypothetical protein